ncbi:MAG: NAD(P)/FAD-dependent oxidoreductase [Halioglobus sp.]
MKNRQHYKCIIIGSGFSGICLAIKMRQRGIDDFIILEKAAGVGGTWRDNHYPGAECDVPSALYSFSFATKTDWDYQWSGQPQILEYIRSTARNNGIMEHVRFDSEVRAARYDSSNGTWEVEVANGETYAAQFVISAVGQLHNPHIPRFPGLASFRGPWFHSARWDHAVELDGRCVAVIGNAASAVQFIPFVARAAGTLVIFQRSANWVSRKRDRPYTDREKQWMRRLPLLQRIARLKTYLRNELLVYPALRGNRLASYLLKTACLGYLDNTVTEPSLRRKLVPDYPVGAKRILVADGYYEALVRENVQLVTDPIEAIDETGIRTQGGQHHTCDVIIFATGFVTNPFLCGIDIRGRLGRALADHWSAGARAYLGIATSEFPNLFFLYGPNTNLGHNSILLMAESQADYILQAIGELDRRDASVIEVRPDVEARYDQQLQSRLRDMVWNAVPDSWYKSGGRISNNWPGSVGEYRRATRTFRPEDYLLTRPH